MALHVIGFEARPLLGRVHLVEPPSGREHLFLLVTLQGRPWIADVGFGGPGFRAPIPFALDRPTSHDGLTFRLVEAGPFGIMLQTLKQGQWLDLYSFDLGHVFPADIALGNHFTATHPGSLCALARVVALPTPSGRVSLLNRTLRIVTDGAEQVRELAEGQAYLDALKSHFGIELDASYAALRPLPGAGQGKGPELEW